MKLQLDDREIKREIRFATQASQRVTNVTKKQLRKHSLTVMRRVKIAMPVDTGAARARWGVAGAPGGVWEVRDNELTIEQGAKLEPYEYIERLNEGSSRQAPAGFIDVVAEDEGLALEMAIEKAVEAILSGANEAQANASTTSSAIGFSFDTADE